MLGCVGLGADKTTVRYCIMHRQFLFQLANLLLIALDQQCLICLLIDVRSVLDLLHASREPQRGQGLLDVVRLRPHIGDQDGVAVAANRVLEHVGELGLPVRHMVSLLVSGADNNLLEEGQRSVDVAGLTHGDSRRTSLLCTLVAREIDQVQLRCDHFLVLLDSRAAFNVHSEDGMRAG